MKFFLAIVLGLVSSGCSIVFGLMLSGSEQSNITGRERKFILDQKAEAYWANRKVLEAAEKETLCDAHRKPEFTVFLNRLRSANERLLRPEVTLAEANVWSDGFRDRVRDARKTCETPWDAGPKAPLPIARDPFDPFVQRIDAGFDASAPSDASPDAFKVDMQF